MRSICPRHRPNTLDMMLPPFLELGVVSQFRAVGAVYLLRGQGAVGYFEQAEFADFVCA